MKMSGYNGFEEDHEETPAPKWLVKAQAKNQKIAAVDVNGKRITLSAFGNVDDRNVFEHQGFYFVRFASDVDYFKNGLRKHGFVL